MLTTLFWCFVLIIIYAYVGYPLIITIASSKSRRTDNGPATSDPPLLSFIVTARNEEKTIGRKIQNTLSLNYPKDRLQILVASNGSTDQTDTIAADFKPQGVNLLTLPTAGKTFAQNAAVTSTSGDILVFSDSDSLYESDTLTHLCLPFQNPKVGVVLGKVAWEDPAITPIGKGESLYWQYENFIKTRESLLGSCIAGSGAIMAVRRELYEHWDPSLMEDFVVPVTARAKGYAVVFQSSAVAWHPIARQGDEQFGRKVRVILQDARALFQLLPRLFKAKRPFLILQILSHKLMRWLVPFLLLGVFMTSVTLRQNPFFTWVTGMQLLFYALAGVGFVFEQFKVARIPLVYIPFYFCLVNAASFIALLMTALGKKLSSWETATPDTK